MSEDPFSPNDDVSTTKFALSAQFLMNHIRMVLGLSQTQLQLQETGSPSAPRSRMRIRHSSHLVTLVTSNLQRTAKQRPLQQAAGHLLLGLNSVFSLRLVARMNALNLLDPPVQTKLVVVVRQVLRHKGQVQQQRQNEMTSSSEHLGSSHWDLRFLSFLSPSCSNFFLGMHLT